MYILDVIPLVKIPKNISQVLTYFSKNSVNIGAIVSVPLGRAKVNALVVASDKIDKNKMLIRSSDFQIRKIDKIISKEPILSFMQMDLFKWFLKYHHSPLGLSAKLFIPSYLVKRKTELKKNDLISDIFLEKKIKDKDILFFKKNRFLDYKREIEKTLKQKKQVLFLVPDLHLLNYWQNKFKDFEPIVLSGSLSPKKYFDAWLSIKNAKNNFIISTRSGVFLNFNNLGLLILDEEDDPSYKSSDMMPYYHTKDVVKKISLLWGAKILYGSKCPDVETYFMVKKNKINLVKDNILSKNKAQLIDMRNEIHGGNYSILSYEVEQVLMRALEKKQKSILFISRKGSESFVFCRDCGYVEKCDFCDLSLIHKKNLGGYLSCSMCSFKKPNPINCPSCESLKIKYFGAGTQKAKEDIERVFPSAKIEILDSDITKNYKEQRELLKKYENGKIDILIGTQLLFKKRELYSSASVVCVLSLDNILSIPEYKSKERFFSAINRASDFCIKKSHFLIQSYMPDSFVLKESIEDDYDSFYKKEISLREVFLYPPFCELIKLIYKHKDNNFAEKECKNLRFKINSLNLKEVDILGPLPAYTSKIKNQYIWHIIIKIKKEKGYEDKKNTLLKNIPEEWVVDVNPKNIL